MKSAFRIPHSAFAEAEWGPVPFDEAIEFFSGKLPMSTKEFYDLAKEARVRAFTVSDVAGMDALGDIQDSLSKALAEGQSFGDWKKGAGELLKKWAIDGFRAETIFRSNIQTAYQVGHYQQMTDPDVLRERPYWRYVAVMDDRTREEHAEWHGTVLPADDPWWNTHYPPNGWRCR